MARRRDKLSRYEVMRPGMLEAAQTPDDPHSDPGELEDAQAAPEPGPHVEAATGRDGWWAQAQRPIVLRLPQGYAVVVGLLLLGLIVLAYEVGYTRGHRGEQPDAGLVGGAVGGAATGWNRVGSGTGQPDGVGRVVVSTEVTQLADDPRQDGMNYFVLAHYPVEDAKRLIGFLSGQGLRAAGFRSGSRRLFQVVVLDGLHKDQLSGDDRGQLEARLKELGRRWRDEGLGPDFSKMGIYLDLYEGESVAEVIGLK